MHSPNPGFCCLLQHVSSIITRLLPLVTPALDSNISTLVRGGTQSIVTMPPDTASLCSRAGMAVISWALVSTAGCARTRRWAVAQALTRCRGPC